MQSTVKLHPKIPYPPKNIKLSPLKGRRLPIDTDNQNPEEEPQSQINMINMIRKKVKKGYEIATYSKAYDHLQTQMYRRKVLNGRDQDYEPYDVCESNDDLKEYGLGVYLYLQFLRRLLITFVIMSTLSMISMVICYQDTGLSNYPDSYTLTLAKFTLGNLDSANLQKYLIVTIVDILNSIIFFIFYVNWRAFHNDTVEDMQKDHTIVSPVTYALSITGFNPTTNNLQENLKGFLDAQFRGTYQVQVVYDYNRQFHLFMQYDALVENVEKEHQIITQTGKPQNQLIQFEKALAEKGQEILNISKSFEPQYAIIHFKTLRAKYSFINFSRRYALINNLSSGLKRCFCCMPLPPERDLFNGRDALMIQQAVLSRPSEINWENLDIGNMNRVLRFICSLIFLGFTVFICSSLIGLCTLYAASTSNCLSFDSTSTTITQATVAGGTTLYCFCAENFSFTGTNSAGLQTACQSLSTDIMITNIVQITASGVSAITNAILIIAIQIIAMFILKPRTKPGEFSFIFILVLITNFFNSTLIPLLINGDIFSFKAVSYLSFINFIDVAAVSIFTDFDKNWYAIIAPYYINFFIIIAVLPFVSFFVFWLKNIMVHWWVRRKCEANQDVKNHPVIQKEANETIAFVVLDFPYETAAICLYLVICLMYSSMIPILIPIFCVALFFTYFLKKTILLKFSITIPANQNLSKYIINILPFALLLHCLFGLWAHTSVGIFSQDSFIIQFNFSLISSSIFTRVSQDILMLALTGLIGIWIIFDFTLISLFTTLKECCCKDQLEMPVQYAAIENMLFSDRLRKSNILGSYKISNHPIYGHAIKAYNELLQKKVQYDQTQMNLQ